MIGQQVTIAGEEWTVDGFVGWSEQYVYLVKPGDEPDRQTMICRPVAVVRRHLELTK